MQNREKFEQLKRLAVLMDSRIKGPFGFSFGLDALIGFIPVLGDLIGTMVSLYILVQAVSFGCSPTVLLRMGLNLLIEGLLELVPFLGNFFDFFWKANNKNVQLLEQHLVNSQGVLVRSRLILALIAFILLAVMVGSVALSVLLLYKFIDFFNLAFS